MKKTLLTLILSAAALTGIQAQNATSWKAIGDYTGVLYIALGAPVDKDMDEPIADQKVSIAANATADDKINFTLPNFSFSGSVLGDIVLPGIKVREEGYKVRFAKNDSVSFNFLDGTILARAVLDETKSYVELDSLVAYVNVTWTNSEAGEFPIYVLFEGIKPTNAITAVSASDNRTARYDYSLLTGRRIDATKPLPHGIYLINGKKVVK